jgi:hypothetical protein
MYGLEAGFASTTARQKIQAVVNFNKIILEEVSSIRRVCKVDVA